MERIGRFVCSKCDYTRVVDSQHIGKRFKCPNCQSPGIVKEISSDDSENLQEGQKSEKSTKKGKFICESCGYTKEVDGKYIGIKCKCSVCHNIGEIKEITEEENKEESQKVKETKGKFICKSCGYTKEVSDKYIGIQCKCPECKNIGEIIAVSDESLSHDTTNTNNEQTYLSVGSEDTISDKNSVEIVEGEHKNTDIIDVQANPTSQNNYLNDQLITQLKNVYDKYAPELQNKIEEIKNKASENIPVLVKNVKEFDYEKTKTKISEKIKDFYLKTINKIKEFDYKNLKNKNVVIIGSIFLFLCLTLCLMSYYHAIEKKKMVDRMITIVEYMDYNQFKILQSDIINEVNIYIDENRNIYKDALGWIASTDTGRW